MHGGNVLSFKEYIYFVLLLSDDRVQAASNSYNGAPEKLTHYGMYLFIYLFINKADRLLKIDSIFY